MAIIKKSATLQVDIQNIIENKLEVKFPRIGKDVYLKSGYFEVHPEHFEDQEEITLFSSMLFSGALYSPSLGFNDKMTWDVQPDPSSAIEQSDFVVLSRGVKFESNTKDLIIKGSQDVYFVLNMMLPVSLVGSFFTVYVTCYFEFEELPHFER